MLVTFLLSWRVCVQCRGGTLGRSRGEDGECRYEDNARGDPTIKSDEAKSLGKHVTTACSQPRAHCQIAKRGW